MVEVVSFRPSKEELEFLEKTRRTLGMRSRAEALRFLIQRGAERSGSLVEDPVFRIRIPGLRKKGRGITSEEIDRELYGGEP